MGKLEKKVQSFINASIVASIVFIILGILFLVFPVGSLEILRWTIVIFAAVIGIYFIVADLSHKFLSTLFNLAGLGVLALVVALVFAVYPKVMNIFPIILGAWFIVSSVTAIRFSAILKGTSGYILAIITAVLSIICGVLLLMNPWAGQISIMMFAGIMIIAYASMSLADMIVLKSNVKVLSNEIKENLKTVESDK